MRSSGPTRSRLARLRSPIAPLTTLVVIAAPLSAQQPAPTPAQLAARARLAEVFLPSRQWRLELTGDGFTASGLEGGNATENGSRFERSTSRLAARLSAPAIIRGAARTVITQDLLYERYGFGYDDFRLPAGLTLAPGTPLRPGYLPRDLHTLQYGAALSQRLDARWRLTVASQAALLTDFENVDLGHVRVTGQVIATKQARPNLQWGGGVAWTNLGVRVLPVVRLLWADGKGQRLDVLLPSRAEYWNEVARNLEVGGAFRLVGNRFTLGGTGGVPFDTAEFVEGTVGPAVALRAGPARFQLEGGASLVRVFRFRGDAVANRNLAPGIGAFGRASVRVNFR